MTTSRGVSPVRARASTCSASSRVPAPIRGALPSACALQLPAGARGPHRHEPQRCRVARGRGQPRGRGRRPDLLRAAGRVHRRVRRRRHVRALRAAAASRARAVPRDRRHAAADAAHGGRGGADRLPRRLRARGSGGPAPRTCRAWSVRARRHGSERPRREGRVAAVRGRARRGGIHDPARGVRERASRVAHPAYRRAPRGLGAAPSGFVAARAHRPGGARGRRRRAVLHPRRRLVRSE